MTHAKVRVALIGAGGWGREHARIFSARPDVDFVAICGRSAEKTATRAAAYGVRPYTDIGQMLVAEKPDLVAELEAEFLAGARRTLILPRPR